MRTDRDSLIRKTHEPDGGDAVLNAGGMIRRKRTALQVGIVGAGLMGFWHAYYAHRLGARIIAVVDPDPAAARALAKRFPEASVFSHVDEMLLTSRPAVLHICTPLSSHVALISRAVQAGIHVLVEKPLTTTTAETREVLAIAERSSAIVCPVHQYAFQDGVLSTGGWLERLGEVVQVRFSICSAGGAGQEGSALDRVVADILPHPFSVLRVLWPQCDLLAGGWTARQPRSGELHVSGVLGETAIDISVSMHARPTRSELDLFCRNGRAHLNFFHGYAVVEQGQTSRWYKLVQPLRYARRSLGVAGGNLMRRALRRELAYPGLRRLIDGFYAAVLGTVTPPISTQDIIAVAMLRDQLTGALRTSRTSDNVVRRAHE